MIESNVVGCTIDHAELTSLYRTYGPIVFRRARAILGSDDEARDAMQAVFARVIAEHHTFKGEVPILRWMYRITTNFCLNLLRTRKAHPVVTDPEAVGRLLEGGRDAVDRHAVAQVLESMDELTQTIAVHYYLDGMKMEEVAELVGKSRKTVSVKLEAFREKARRMLS